MFKTRLYSGRALAIAACVIGMSLILASVVLAALPAGYSVTFVGATYDSGTNETTFTYRVCADGSQAKGLSHWDIQLCTNPADPDKSAYDLYVDGSAQGYGIGARSGVTYCEVEAVNPDPTCSLVTGIKFAEPRTDCADPATESLLGEGGATGCDEFTFKLEKNWTGAALGKTGFALKIGTDCSYAELDELVTGPDCDTGPTAVTLSSFAAKSSAGGWASPLWLGLAGFTVLAAGSLFWAKRRSG